MITVFTGGGELLPLLPVVGSNSQGWVDEKTTTIKNNLQKYGRHNQLILYVIGCEVPFINSNIACWRTFVVESLASTRLFKGASLVV